MEQVPFSNASFIPAAAMDLLLAFPRLAQRAGSLAFYHMPEAMDNIAGKIFSGGSMIADATSQHITNSTITNTSRIVAQSTAAAAMDAAFQESLREGGSSTSTSMVAMMLQFVIRVKNFGGIFSYLTSKWALATFAVAIVLNRTQFYASSREHLRLQWYMRLALYAVPLTTVLAQMLRILQALKCQTSPDFPLLRYGDPLKNLAIDFAADGDFLYKLSSILLFWTDDASCCAARNMSIVALGGEKSELRGSMSLLFLFFLTLCASQLFETLFCALQGKQPMPETGMTLFEHSLAFAECEAMISSALGFGFFGSSKSDAAVDSSSEAAVVLLSRSEILQRLNVPPEVLLVCLISCFSHLSSAILAVLGIRHKVRLLNTGIWACFYMGAFVWSFTKVFYSPTENISDLGVLRFPTVCIVGFIPHVLIMFGVIVCGSIYGLALLVTALSGPPEITSGLTFGQRFVWAYRNLQANCQFTSNANVRIKMSEDFYTALLKIGFSILTAASEAVYLNEGSPIRIAQMTWLEQKAIDRAATLLDTRQTTVIPPELLGEGIGIARGVHFSDHQHTAVSLSPYARERRSKPGTRTRDKQQSNEQDTGIGLTQRRNRMQLTFDFLAGMFWLIVHLFAHMLVRGLQRVGVQNVPRWLRRASGQTLPRRKETHEQGQVQAQSLEILFPPPSGVSILPQNGEVDVEAETRRLWSQSGQPLDEDSLNSKLYNWWRNGGCFGDIDTSGEFQDDNDDDDDDTTSVTSMSTIGSTARDGSDLSDDDGRLTPTPRDPLIDLSREGSPSPDGELDLGLLSRLLDPQTADEREEARLLSRHLQSGRPMTRSLYRREQYRNRVQLLAGLRGSQHTQRSEAEEERDLEQFILSRRSQPKATSSKPETWDAGAEGMGAGGPQCVVCQSTPRTVLVWPCGCLSMCDDCRIGLAARNHTKCICCRTEIAAYSRLYVP